MTINESRVKDGTLTLGDVASELDASCQLTNIRMNSSYDDDGDDVETLCGERTGKGRKKSGNSLAGTMIQDWAATPSVIDYVWQHDLEVVPFTYAPNGAAGVTITGSVRLEVPGETYGGDVNARNTSDFEWFVVGEITRTPPVGADAAATRSSSSAPELADA
jgi:hypothetical protein